MTTDGTTTTQLDGLGRASETEAALAAGIAIAKPFAVTSDDTKALVYFGIDGEPKVVDMVDTLSDHQEHPARKTGTFQAHDAAWFTRYLDKHRLDHETEIWADALRQQVTAVINGHQGTTEDGDHDYAGWADHRVVYQVTPTDAWKAWLAKNGQLMSQSDFAELIEMRMPDVVTPTAADMLELAQTFEATIGVRFESSKILSSGERQLTYKEDVESRAGRSGQLEIPKEFELALQPFEGANTYRVTARFRFRITDGTLRLGYVLIRPEDVLRTAFEDVVTAIEENAGDIPVFRGVTG